MQGASGSFYSSGKNYNTGEVRLIVSWTQTFTPGSDYSTITVSAKLQRQNTETYTCGGTWYANNDNGVLVGSTRVCGWYKGQSAGLTNPWDVGWTGSGTITVNHTAETTVTINIQAVNWNNSTYSASSVSIPAKSVTITLQAIPQAYTLELSPGSGSWISVNRTSSPKGGASIGTVSSGTTIYDEDVLIITGGANSGYALESLTANGVGISSGASITVSGAVNVESTAKQQGLVYIDSGSGWDAYQVYIDNGSSWDLYAPHIDNGSSWDLQS